MTSEIRKDLIRARNFYKDKKYQDAFEIYEKHFSENPKSFDYWDKVRYCWSMYYLFIKDQSDETELFEYAETVTSTIRQVDLKKNPVCVYTQCVFSVIMSLKSNQDWAYMLYWLDKLNPNLLSDNEKENGTSRYRSKKEDYYHYLSIAYLKCEDYEECINTSKEALDKLSSFAYDGDVWHMWRIGKSLNRLSKPDEALEYLNKVIEIKSYWYILKEIADCYYKIGDNINAMEYARQSVFADGETKDKVNLYLLVYHILKESDFDMALKHAMLYLAIKLEFGGMIDEEIEDLDIDEDSLEFSNLEKEIEDYWLNI